MGRCRVRSAGATRAGADPHRARGGGALGPRPTALGPQPLQGRAVPQSLGARRGRGGAVPRDASRPLEVTPAAGPFPHIRRAARPPPAPANGAPLRAPRDPRARPLPPIFARQGAPATPLAAASARQPPSRPAAPVSPAPSSFTRCHRGAGDNKGAAASSSTETPAPCPTGAEPPPRPGPAAARTHLSPAQLHPTEAPTPHSGAPNSRPRPGVWRQHATPPPEQPPAAGRGSDVTEPRRRLPRRAASRKGSARDGPRVSEACEGSRGGRAAGSLGPRGAGRGPEARAHRRVVDAGVPQMGRGGRRCTPCKRASASRLLPGR